MKIRRTLLFVTPAVAVLMGSTAPGTARADWLVTRDGARIETKGTWKVDGRRVLFTMPNGTLSTLRTDEVDLDQSALVTTQAKEVLAAPVPAVPPKKEPVLRLTEKDIPPVGAGADGADDKAGDGKGEGKDAVKPTLEVLSWEKSDNASGEGVEIFGTLKNSGSDIVVAPSVMVAIYDADGGLLATSSGDVNSPQVQAGKTANFRVAFPGVPDFAAVKFDAQGRTYKPRVENQSADETEAPEFEEPAEMPAEDQPPVETEEPPSR